MAFIKPSQLGGEATGNWYVSTDDGHHDAVGPDIASAAMFLVDKLAAVVKPQSAEEIGPFGKLTPERKLKVLKAMGFQAYRDDHQPDCEYAIDAGNRCQCVRPATSWSAPHDVVVAMHETYDERKADKTPRPIYESER